MAAVAFDTLKFVEKLEAAGVPSAQAKATAQAFAEASGEQLATRADIVAIRADFKEELAPIKAKMDLLQWMLGFTLAAIMAIFYILIKR